MHRVWPYYTPHIDKRARHYLCCQDAAGLLVHRDNDAGRLLIQHHQIMELILAKPASNCTLRIDEHLKILIPVFALPTDMSA